MLQLKHYDPGRPGLVEKWNRVVDDLNAVLAYVGCRTLQLTTFVGAHFPTIFR